MSEYIVCLQNGLDFNSGKNWLDMLGQFFLLIVIFIVILALAYYSTKWASNLRMRGAGSLNMKVLESVSVGNQSMIELIKAGNKYFLVGVTKDNITFLTEIDEDNLVFDEDGEFSKAIPFEKYLKDYFNKKKK